MSFGWDADDLLKHLEKTETRIEGWEEQKAHLKVHEPPIAEKAAEVLLKELSIDLSPYGKPRGRCGGRKVHMPPKYQEWRKELRRHFGRVLSDYPLKIELVAYRKALSKWRKEEKEKMLGKYCTSTPDIDNAIGAVMDALMKDDSAVAAIVAEKRWGKTGSMTIRVYELHE